MKGSYNIAYRKGECMEGKSRVRKWNAESDGAFALLCFRLLLKVNKNLEQSEKKKKKFKLGE